MKVRSKRTFRVAFGIALIPGLLAIWGFLIEPNRLVLHNQVINLKQVPSGFDGIKIAALGDLHAGSPFITREKLRKVVALTNSQKPDVIILLGDLMVREKFYQTPVEPELIAAELKELQAPLGIFAVLGNHDWWFNGYRVKNSLQNAGIRVLENEVAEVRKGQQSLWLVGLADAWTRPQDVAGTVGKVPPGAFAIAVTHNPDVFAEMPSTVQLTIAAHTHGGQVNLPLVGRLVVPSNYGQRYAAGYVEENGKKLFVTTGVGTSIIPVRFRVPPEIAILTIKAS